MERGRGPSAPDLPASVLVAAMISLKYSVIFTGLAITASALWSANVSCAAMNQIWSGESVLK